MKRLLFVTDSLGAPRSKPEECYYNDTWCYKVSKNMESVESIFYNINGLDTDKLLLDTSTKLTMYSPDIVIIQVGIVDCAPRALTKIEVEVIKRLGVVGKYFRLFIKKNYSSLTKLRNIAYVNTSKFESNLLNIKEKFGDVPIFAISIGKPSDKYKFKSPLIEKRWKEYNEILEKVFGNYYIDPYEGLGNSELENIYMSDDHHLNNEGHTLIARYISEKLLESGIIKES